MLKTSGQQDVWRTIFPSAIEIEYGGRYPADFCIIDYFISSDDCELVQRRRRHPLVAAYRNPSCARPASFCFFYTALVFNSRETADNLKKSGAFVPGIRPREQTARYIDKILTRLTLAGAIYIVFVCLLPEFLVLRWNVPFYIGGTSLLIIVVVTMDFMEQARSYLMSQQYESLLRKANFKGGKFPVR